jgi:PKD repeat protein
MSHPFQLFHFLSRRVLKNLSRFCLIAWLPLQADTYLAPGLISGSKDEVVEVPIFLQTDQNLVGAEFILEYDATVLEVGSIQKGSSLGDHEIFEDQDTAGSLKMTILSMTNESLKDGNLTLVSFLLLEDVPLSSLILSIDADDTLLVSQSKENFAFSPLHPLSDLKIEFPSQGGDLLSFDPGTEITFQASADGSFPSFTWQLGDGTTLESNSSFSYSYAKPGQYLITLTAKNQFGSLQETVEVLINDQEEPPTDTEEDNEPVTDTEEDEEPIEEEVVVVVEEEAPKFAAWDEDASDLGYGWKKFDWFGNFFPVQNSKWLFHQRLGWLYRVGDTVDNTWLWSEIWGWSWVSHESFPYFAHSSGDWLYYFDGTSSPLRFYDYGLERWIEHDPANLLKVDLGGENHMGGQVMGPLSFYKGENLSFVAQPAEGYLFAGWTGDINSGENPLIIQNQRKNLSLAPKFLPLGTLRGEGAEALNLEHLSKDQRQRAMTELLLLGSSDLIQAGNAEPYIFSAQGNANQVGLFSSQQSDLPAGHGVFDGTSASIDHDYFPVLSESGQLESLVQNSKRLIRLEFTGTETIRYVSCAKVKITHSNEDLEERWCAQDRLGNVWLLQSEIGGESLQKEPTILLPANLESGWKSWSASYAVPVDYAIVSEYPESTRPLNSSVHQNCALIRLHRSKMGAQLEIYAPGSGLVKISK